MVVVGFVGRRVRVREVWWKVSVGNYFVALVSDFVVRLFQG